MKNLLTTVGILGISSLLSQSVHGQTTRNPDLPNPGKVIALDTSDGWKTLTPQIVNYKGHYLNMHLLRDPLTGHTSAAAYEFGLIMRSVRTDYGYAVFLMDTTEAWINHRDTIALYHTDSLYEYCANCLAAYTPTGSDRHVSEKIHFFTNNPFLIGVEYYTCDPRWGDDDTRTIKWVAAYREDEL